MNKWVMQTLKIVPMLIVMGTIFYFSHQPGSSIHLPPFPGSDKVFHATAYGVLAVTVLFALSARFKRKYPVKTVIIVVLICLIYGMSDEYHQSFIPFREPDIFDVLADSLGGIIVGTLWYSIFRSKGRNKN